MRVLDSPSRRRTATLSVLLADALPVAGLVAFGWRPVQALFVAWLTVGATLLATLALVAFGQRESRPNRKTGGTYPGAVPLPVPAASVRPLRSLPPLRLRNLRYVPAAIPLVALVWLVLSRAFLEFPMASTAVGGRPDLGTLLGHVAAAATPAGLALAALAAALQWVTIGRDFLAAGLVEGYSAAMLQELPLRIAAVWFVVLLALFPAYAGTVLLDPSPALVEWGFFSVLLATTVGVDLALVRARYDPDPGVVTGLFVPNRRPSEPRSQADGVA